MLSIKLLYLIYFGLSSTGASHFVALFIPFFLLLLYEIILSYFFRRINLAWNFHWLWLGDILCKLKRLLSRCFLFRLLLFWLFRERISCNIHPNCFCVSLRGYFLLLCLWPLFSSNVCSKTTELLVVIDVFEIFVVLDFVWLICRWLWLVCFVHLLLLSVLLLFMCKGLRNVTKGSLWALLPNIWLLLIES